jgi:hypothetical protein
VQISHELRRVNGFSDLFWVSFVYFVSLVVKGLIFVQ